MPKCRYEGCNEEALPDSPNGYCIFHEDIKYKDVKKCMELFYEKLKNGEGNFNGYVLKNMDLTRTEIKVIQHVVSFTGAKFYGVANFYNIVFKEADFSMAEFEKADFRKAKFEIAIFSEAKFEEANFKGTQFRKADFHAAKFRKAGFSEAKFGKADFSGAEFEDADFSEAEFEEAYFLRTQFRKGDFSWAKLEAVDFTGAKFEEALFPGVQFKVVAGFSKTGFRKADFSWTAFGGSFFSEAKFKEVNFSAAIFEEADFSMAEFEKANFSGVQFERIADFSGLNVKKEINFEGAILNRAIFDGVDLTKIRFYGAFIETSIISRAIFRDKCFIEERNAINMERELFTNLKNIVKDKFIFRRKIFSLRKNLEKIKKRFREIAMAFGMAEDVYRNIKLSLQNEGDYETAGEFYYKEMLMRRKKAFYERRFLYWILSNIYSKLCGYGEKPLRVILSALVTILFFGTLYWLMDAITGEGFNGSVFDYYYFSVVTFTTLGFGDIHPATFPGKLAAMAEALIGAFMMALFVLVFGRKMLR